jgi:hypothetical protein
MQAEIQHFGGQIRIWKDGDTPYVDPYDWSMGVNWTDHETAEVVGATKPLSPEAWKAAEDALIRAGAKYLKIVRMRKGS